MLNPKQITGIYKEASIVGAVRWSLPFLAALLPIVLLSLFSYQTASTSVRNLVREQNLSATANVSQLLTQDFKRMSDIAHAVASVPGTIEAVREKDDIAMRERLRAVVLAYPQIDRAFLTDRRGMLWTDYPQAPGAYGASQVESDWYQGLSSEWKPYISNIYIRPHDALSPVVAIAMPMYDETGRIIGALVFEYKTRLIHRWLQDIKVGRGGFVYIVDEKGNVVAHPSLDPDEGIHAEYKILDIIDRSRGGGLVLTEEYEDPLLQTTVTAAVQPVSIGDGMWVVVAMQPSDTAFAPLESVRWNISLAGGILTLVTLGMVIALGLAMRKNERLNRELAAKNQTLQDITSFVSHQLRAPVTAMRWSIEEIMDGDTGPIVDKTKEALKELHGVAIQNGKLIDDILNVSRIDRGVIEVKTELVQLKDIAERALRDYRVALEKAGLSLTLNGMDLACTVQADLEKVAEAVTNSISNAIKHTKKGGITVSLRKDERFGYIDVSDTGEGMTPDIMAKLFDRAGVKGSNTDSAASTGLGLYIARNFMQLQKGDITVRSEPGKGSTFTYAIPLASSAGSLSKNA